MKTTDGQISIQNNTEPPPPPPPPIDPQVAAISFEFGTQTAAPGSEVALPVVVETGIDLYRLRIVASYDAQAVELLGFRARYLDSLGSPAETFIEFPQRGFGTTVCTGSRFDRVCVDGMPARIALYSSELGDSVPEETVILDSYTSYFCCDSIRPRPMLFWEAGGRYSLGDLVFRVKETNLPGTVLQVVGAKVKWHPQWYVFEAESVCSGFPPGFTREVRQDVPAIEVLPGKILVAERGKFIRGDSDGDGAVDITDPIDTLNTLFFSGGPWACADAADADDDGSINITDAIYTLQHLYLGGPSLPPPFPTAGSDPTQDTLGCDRAP